MAESPILHDLPRIRSVVPEKQISPPPYSSTPTTAAAAAPATDSYFVLQPHGPKPNENKSMRSSYIEKSDTDIGIAVTTPSPSSPLSSSSSLPSASPHTPISPSLFPVPPSRASTPNASIPTSRSASTLLSTTTRGCGSSLGNLSMATSSTSLAMPATPATAFSSPASTPTPFSPKRASSSPRFRLVPSTPSPVCSPRPKRGSRSPRVYPGSDGAGGACGGLYIETKRAEAETLASKRLRRLSKRLSACSEHQQQQQQHGETPRSPAYSGFWLEVPAPRPATAPPRPASGCSATTTTTSSKAGEETEMETDADADADSDSISPILPRPALLKALGTNTSRRSINVVSGGDYDTHSLSAMWFGETRRRACDYPCCCAGVGVGPEPDFAVAVVRERQRRRRRVRRVKAAGGVAVIAVLLIVAVVVGVSLSVR